jgi:hypothetical protein
VRGAKVIYSHVKLVSVSKTSGTNLPLVCIFSNLFALQAKFFADYERFNDLFVWRPKGSVIKGNSDGEKREKLI